MDFYVVLNRPGYRVAKRKAKCAKIGYQHKVTKTDAVKWFQVCTIVRTVDALFCVPSIVPGTLVYFSKDSENSFGGV